MPGIKRKRINIPARFAMHNANIFLRKYKGISRSNALKMGWKAMHR